MDHTDIISIDRLRKGDMQAFEHLFKAYYEKLCLFAARFTDDLHVAEEIVADTYALLWEKRETILINLSFRSYIYRAVQNRCLNHLKHKHVEKEYIDHVLQTHLPPTDYHEVAREEELEKEVEEAIESLPEKCREIFKLSRFHHLRYQEIADRLGISPKTVERQIMIALEKLRRHLKHLVASA
ncbi:RNA polymerase sigma-70 factor [Puia sp.]|jgi:RNA polymerase sigma-70 factor (ECF subfamily)|uniref:RNA polymerase sigma-70 factor n=1 Tax=Puia sp. TaxID=2045100 RepID=UPI002F3FDBF0